MVDDLKIVLVTGASGYLGGRVIDHLRARGRSCLPVSARGAGETCDLTSDSAVRALLAGAAPGAILHCAARVPKSAAGYDDEQAAADSLSMVAHLVRHARCPIVFASSMTVYGPATRMPAREAAAGEPASAYARGKLQGESILLERRRPGDVALRLPGLFGMPRRNGVLYNATRRFLTGGEFEPQVAPVMWAAMSVEDAAAHLVSAAIDNPSLPSEVVNVGYENEFCLPEALNMLAVLCGVNWRRPAGTAPRFQADLVRSVRRFGALGHTFEERLAQLVEAVRAEMRVEKERSHAR